MTEKLIVTISFDAHTGTLILNFGRDVSFIGMDAATGRAIATMMLAIAVTIHKK